jgi:ureidoglycolate hydrolase
MTIILKAQPLTAEALAPYGDVMEANSVEKLCLDRMAIR